MMRPAGRLGAYVLTYNEAPSLRRCLACLKQLTDDLVVVDAESTDATRQVAAEVPGVRIIRRPMPHSFAEQRNFALQQLDTEWVLTLDADEEFAPGLLEDLPSLVAGPFDAYIFPRFWTIPGRPGEIHWTVDGDPQIRLFRRREEIRYTAPADGLHEYLTYRGLIIPRTEVRSPVRTKPVSYPILHHKLQKEDEALVRCTDWYLERQRPETPFPLGPETFVQAKQRLQSGTPIADYATGLFGWPELRSGDLDNVLFRIRELADYTGLTTEVVQERLQGRRGFQHERVLLGSNGSTDDRWSELFDRTRFWLTHAEAKARRRRLTTLLQGAQRILMVGDGLGDLALNLFLAGVPEVVFNTKTAAARDFFQWRLARYRLELPVVEQLHPALLEEPWDAVVCANVQELPADGWGRMIEPHVRTSLLIADFRGPLGTGGTPRVPGAAVGTRTLAAAGWQNRDHFSWYR